MGTGTAVRVSLFLTPWEKTLGRWHRSKDKKQKPGSEFGSYMMNKKWWLEEELNVHMMRFQQVKSTSVNQTILHPQFQAGLTINDLPFENEEEEEKIEPLTMEHFYLPLIFLGVGLLMSTVTFIAEIILKRCQRNDH